MDSGRFGLKRILLGFWPPWPPPLGPPPMGSCAHTSSPLCGAPHRGGSSAHSSCRRDLYLATDLVFIHSWGARPSPRSMIISSPLGGGDPPRSFTPGGRVPSRDCSCSACATVILPGDLGIAVAAERPKDTLVDSAAIPINTPPMQKSSAPVSNLFVLWPPGLPSPAVGRGAHRGL